MKTKTNTIDISKLDKAEVLAALYNGSRQQGMGFMNARGGSGMTAEQASKEINTAKREMRSGRVSIRFDYLHGRVMKLDIGGDTLDPRLYDRDNGQGSARNALDSLMNTK